MKLAYLILKIIVGVLVLFNYEILDVFFAKLVLSGQISVYWAVAIELPIFLFVGYLLGNGIVNFKNN